MSLVVEVQESQSKLWFPSNGGRNKKRKKKKSIHIRT